MQFKQHKKLKTYLQLFPEFLEQSSIHGLKVFLLYVPANYAKKLWLGFITIVIIWTHFVIVNLTIDFIQQPTELHMSTNLVHVAYSPFPAIAICSANKISRRKLMAYAEEIYTAQQAYRPGLLRRTVEEMAEELVSLAGFYLHPYYDFESNDINLQRLHDILTFKYNNSDYNVRDILHDLAPNCEDIVVRSLVLGKPINVSEYFVKRITSSSICCMFNYERETYSWDYSRRLFENKIIDRVANITFESNAIINSIQIVAQMDLNDVVYKDLSNDAFQLNIFSSEDYPSIQSNTVGELLVDLNSIIEIPIQPKFFASSSQIRSFPPRVRKCYFSEEGQKIINSSYYSIDECLLVCRMQSMVKYCGCVSPPMIATSERVKYCNLMDLPCLTKWKSVWYGWNYFDYVNVDTEDLKSTYEGCDHCLPTCDGVEYDLDMNKLPLRKATGQVYTTGILAGLSNTKPLSLIKIFFQQRFAPETIEDVVADWILLLNRFGGIMSLMYGFSIISYIEIFYYLSGKWFYHLCSCKRKTMDNLKTPDTKEVVENQIIDSKQLPPRFNLYWKELIPKHIEINIVQDPVVMHLIRKK